MEDTHKDGDISEASGSSDSEIEETHSFEKTVKDEDEEVNIRNQLMELPFEELQQLKEKIGLKAYREVLFGTEDKQRQKRVFKRENKNRPMEISSKKPVSKQKNLEKSSKKVHRDPRFDDLSGEYSEHFFKDAYSFVFDMKKEEKQKILKKLKKEKDPEKKSRLEDLITRLNDQEQSEMNKNLKVKKAREWKKEEKKLVAAGKRPFYLKKSDEKKLQLAEQFRALKKSNKLENYLQRKRKRNAAKEKKKLPNKPI